MNTATLVDDLRAEGDELDALVRDLPAEGWATATPAPGWSIAHQIAHLAWTDAQALWAIKDPDGFTAGLAKAAADPGGFVDAGAEEGAREDPARLLHRWRTGRAQLATALQHFPVGSRIVWYGPPMAAGSMATARLMETWAHGLDVAEALGVRREPTRRLRHVAHLGVRTLGFSFQVNGLPAPAADVRVELLGPDGERWEWGPEDAENRVSGPALDFCLLVTRRRHPDDLALEAVGEVARQWLRVAQAFAGPPGPDPAPRRKERA
ncbi:TIGR03084 family protein [Streptoalloteichus tenebrarius]|uniref:TIGR03084 family protein n=1 Tax=Streptoalloteichus tenebrarius (strain ATCC 17920 / DSM 40477 / JCM 4838 / CBS 697.72 / NBRC 16177 / NCIMB 11028 / NRRL B-12390 / A12253. 1 / ISP 5477) TaxID=1933 RepID=A0ABT1HXS5_STRSD|nr:TIGR03084 family metal-binding protein [Streptoalloteichus tenebrarius]MCP2260332.1 TIGR03084 family protein [Streptoalloteichus tenebrarius]BFF03082.1 TIGR03084 family metal-binding protein [Streptoalloteichus tenebrarius]